MTNKPAEISKAWQIFSIALLSAVVLFPDLAFAFTYNGGGQVSGIGATICWMGAAFLGEVAAGIATVAVCAFGTLACLGRVQWTQGLVVGVGISILFGAGWIIADFGGSGYCS